jgi:hypothetical protein
VRVKGLASKILALSARHMPYQWQTLYGHRPLLLETLVDATRFRGTCYRAANWIYVGQTTGRGRMDREHKSHGQAIKDIYVYPLVRDLYPALASMLRTCRKEGIHILENVGCWLDRPGLPKIPTAYHRTLPSALYYYKAADRDLAATLANSNVWAPTTFDGDASL